MKIKSVSGITCLVKSLERTAKFYEALGFEIRKREPNHITAYSNWFWMDFRAVGKEARPEFKKLAEGAGRSNGQFIYLSVDDVDGFHKQLAAKGVKAMTAPQERSWGDAEFVLRDPDGYNLVIFKRK
jgi:catechol 2,3-dioxygenase-like lactoylglutathione lyase family enzyme